MLREKLTTRSKLENIRIFDPARYLPILHANLGVKRIETILLLRQQGVKHTGRVDLFDVATGESPAGRPSRSLVCIPSRMARFKHLLDPLPMVLSTTSNSYKLLTRP